MKVTAMTFFKEYKHGLPNYSNITASMGITIEVNEDEEVDIDKVWDTINQEIMAQATLDPAWMDEAKQKKVRSLDFKRNR